MSLLLDALLPKTRQKILAATFLHPERWWYASDLARFVGSPPSSLQRELILLVEAGILRRREEDHRIYFQPETESPIYPELRGLLFKTAGVSEQLRNALTPLWEDIDFAFLYGSFARGTETAQSDIDLMIIGSVSLSQLIVPLRDVERAIDRPVNPSLYTLTEFSQKANRGSHFVASILVSPKIYLKGSENELDSLIERPANPETYDKHGGVK